MYLVGFFAPAGGFFAPVSEFFALAEFCAPVGILRMQGLAYVWICASAMKGKVARESEDGQL